MYTPAHFAETRPEVLQALMAAHPLATLIVSTSAGLLANHIPLRFVPATDPADAPAPSPADACASASTCVPPNPSTPTNLAAQTHAPALLGYLRGHVARANTLWQEFDPAVQALAVFQGPQAYISPAWYASKRDDGRVVPTWNYAVVHAHGPLHIHDDPAWTHALVVELTQEHEGRRPAPWAVSDAPDDYIARMNRAIVGIEIPVLRLAGKWKTSGNQLAANRAGVSQALAASPHEAERHMAALVAAHDGGASRP